MLTRRYLRAIQSMEDGTIPNFCPCCVLLRPSLPHIPPAKNRYRIFIRPVLRKKVLAWGKTGSDRPMFRCVKFLQNLDFFVLLILY